MKKNQFFGLRIVAAFKFAVLVTVIAATGIFGSVTATAQSSTLPAAAREAGKAYELVVLHTNDHHGTTVSKDGLMGLAERATFVKRVQGENKNVLILDAGDINMGTALSNMFDAEPDIKAYNMIGYKAAAFGNHEFDKPLSVLDKQIELADFDFVNANITRKNGAYLDKPYVIVDYDGFRVAVIGLTTLRTRVTARPDASLKWAKEIDAAKKTIADVRKKENPDIVILLGHLGDVLETDDQTTSVKLCEALAKAKIKVDLVVDGHSHSNLQKPIIVGGIPIVSSWEWGKNVGKANLTIVDGAVTEFKWQPVKIDSKTYPPDAAVIAMLAPYIQKSNASLKEVVMKTAAEFPFKKGNTDRISRFQESEAGDLVCDSYTWYLKNNFDIACDFAITNGGNIRSALPAGDVTREAIKTMMPFDNWVYMLKLNGSDVKALFEHVASQNQGAGGFAQVSKEVKYTITYDEKGGNGKISGITISGKPINDKTIYTIATNDYMADGGDGYIVFKNKRLDFFNTSMLVSDILIDYAKTFKEPVKPSLDGRITIVGGSAK
ncbi:MAG: bifunctional UDP-sugar hydrolase/5'-nucleotidase [Termitinemataceae bacterium]|nr:MAG: bifunctional UDP-sugar hydrolase/5'-nucleotidase [Termitinemataceae bacterium]